MIEQGKGGRIINMASDASKRGRRDDGRLQRVEVRRDRADAGLGAWTWRRIASP